MLPPYLTTEILDDLIRRALDEDIGSGDVTSLATVPATTAATGYFLAKEEGVVAGLFVADRVLRTVDPSIQTSWTVADGEAVTTGRQFGTVQGPARSILMAERLTLNLMQRMSGIASLTARMVEAVGARKARLLDTRKTAPGLRPLDKWGVLLGGGQNHRIGLFDMILIKDNHIAASGGVRQALEAARAFVRDEHPELKIEIEAGTLDQVEEVLRTGGADYILLDNMVRFTPDGVLDTSLLKEAVTRIDGRILTEASGNVTLESVSAIAETGVDFISCGALTHSVRALDISLKIRLA